MWLNLFYLTKSSHQTGELFKVKSEESSIIFLPDEQEVCSKQQLSGEQKHVSTITPQFSLTPAASRNIWKMWEAEQMHFNTEATKAS